MIEANLEYTSGLKYNIKFQLKDGEITEWLERELGEGYSEAKRDTLLTLIKESLTFSNPIVSAKWTTLKKDSNGKESLGGWSKKKQHKKNTITTVQEERYL